MSVERDVESTVAGAGGALSGRAVGLLSPDITRVIDLHMPCGVTYPRFPELEIGRASGTPFSAKSGVFSPKSENWNFF